MYDGIDYEGQVENFTLSNASQDLFQIATGATVPMLVRHIIVTAGTTSQNIMRVQLVRRSTASSTSTASGTFAPKSPASTAASATLLAGLTALGTVGSLLAPQEWNVAAPLEFDYRPKSIIIAPATWLCLFVPAAFGSTLPLSVWIECAEIK
jgi:hypothetical protein